MVLLFRNDCNKIKKLFCNALYTICPDATYPELIYKDLSRLDIKNIDTFNCDMIISINIINNDYIIFTKGKEDTVVSFNYSILISKMKKLLLDDINNTLFNNLSIKIDSTELDLYDNYIKIKSKYIGG